MVFTMTNTNRTALRNRLENARVENYSARVQHAMNRQLAAERAELVINERTGSAMAIANRNAIADLMSRGAR